jgi:flagellar hook-associated protein 2
MGVSLSGIFSGINSDSIISQLIAADSKPMQLVQGQVTTDQTKETAEASIVTSLTQLQTAANALVGTQNLNSLTASSSNSQVLSATASATATEGTHTVVVHQLASAAQEIQAGVIQKETWTLNQQAASADDPFLTADQLSGGTNFSFQFGSEAAVTVDLSSYAATGITLNQLVGAINSAAGYTAASAVSTGGKSQLQLRAQDAGTGLGLTIPAANTVSALSSLSQFTQTVSGVAGGDTLVGAGQFVYTYNGVTRTIQTNAKTTLSNLQDLLNNDSGNPGVSASILDHKVDDDHEFHLVLAGGSTGTQYGITVSSATTLAGFAPGASWTPTQQAQDSQIQVDNYPATGWIQRSSNTIADVIPGVTMNLTGLSADGVSVTVNQDTSHLTTNLQALVTDYNAAVTTIGKYTNYDTANQKGGLLQGDGTFVDLLYGVRDALTANLGGFTGSASALSTAGQIGLSIDKTGVLSLDTTMLSSALSSNYKGVLDLIGAQNTGQSDNSTIQFGGATSAMAGGDYDVQVNFDASGNIGSALMRVHGQTAWAAATVKGNVISGAKGTPEAGLFVTANWDGVSTAQTADITVRQGLATQMSSSLGGVLDPTTGVLATWKSGMDDEIKSLNSSISDMQARLDQEQQDLQNQFVLMETTLAQLDEQLQAIKSLSGTSSSSSSSSSSGTSVGTSTPTLDSGSSSNVSNTSTSYTPTTS